MRKLPFSLMVLVCFSLMFVPILGGAEGFAIIPEPAELVAGEGEFVIGRETRVVNQSGLELGAAISLFCNQVEASSGVKIVTSQADNGNSIVLKLAEETTNEASSEGYKLEVGQGGVTLEASTYAGFFYGFQTLLQLLPPEIYSTTQKAISLALPSVTIKDAPRFSYRGFMLDVSRHFYPASTIKLILNELGKMKINTFHWHLTDDGGFRFPFEGVVTHNGKEYDLDAFTRKTSYRTGSTREIANFMNEGKPDAENWQFVDITNLEDPNYQHRENAHGGFYTQAEIKELIAYAKVRNIEIIPEFDIPGHSTPLYVFFEDMRCDDKITNPLWDRRSKSDSLADVCISSDATFAILTEMLRQIATTFESDTIHIGADEVRIDNHSWYPIGRWWFCKRCEDKMRTVIDKRFAHANYKNLQQYQGWFLKEIESILASMGKKCAIWNEGMKGGFVPAAGTTMYNWVGSAQLPAAKKHGIQVVNTNTHKYYFDFYQHKSDRKAGNPDAQSWGGSGPTITMETVYNHDPTKTETGVSMGENQIGIQACMWSERIIGFNKGDKTWSRDEHLLYMIFPRLYPVAERAWSPESKKNWNKFDNKLQTQFLRLDNAGITKYADHYKR